MDKQLQARIDDALKKAIERREWEGRPFTIGDVCSDSEIRALMELPEIQKAIAIDRITEILEEERIRTGVSPTMEEAKRLIEREAELLKFTRQERESRMAEPCQRELGDEDIN